MAERFESTPTKMIEHVFVSLKSKEEICLLCAKGIANKDFRRKLTTSGGRKKTKACFNFERRSPVILFGSTLHAVIVLTEIKH